jgi:hypothetical protein
MANDLFAVERRALTPSQFGDLADVPPELEWLANITDPKTRRAYKNDVGEFSAGRSMRGSGGLAMAVTAVIVRLLGV